MTVHFTGCVIIHIQLEPALELYLSFCGYIEVFPILLNERVVVGIILVNGVDEHTLLPLLSTAESEGVFIEEVGCHHGLRLDPAVLTRDNDIGFIVFLFVASDATINGLFDDGDFILIGTRYPRCLTAGFNT